MAFISFSVIHCKKTNTYVTVSKLLSKFFQFHAVVKVTAFKILNLTNRVWYIPKVPKVSEIQKLRLDKYLIDDGSFFYSRKNKDL